MTRLLPLSAIAGALVSIVAIGGAQAAAAPGNMLGKSTIEAGSTVEKAGYRHHRKWWKKRYYRRHQHHRRGHHRGH